MIIIASESFKAFREKVGTAGSGTLGPDEPAPVGTWLAGVAVALAKVTKAGNHRLSVKFRIDSGPNVGKSAWWGKDYRPDNEDALKWFFGFTDTMGVDWDAPGCPKDGADAEGIVKFVADQLAGKRAQIKCVEGPEFPKGSGRKDVEVKFVNKVPKGSPEPQQKAAAKAMNAMPHKPSAPAKPAAPVAPTAPNAQRDKL